MGNASPLECRPPLECRTSRWSQVHTRVRNRGPHSCCFNNYFNQLLTNHVFGNVDMDE